MIRSVPSSGNALRASVILLLALLGATLLYFAMPPALQPPPPTLKANSPAIEYELTEADLHVDWPAGGPEFDPHDKCPPDFFKKGFRLVLRRRDNGAYAKFLYHKGKKLLYRIDKDVIEGKAKVGLHWVASTKPRARYRIADRAYKEGKAVKVPNAKGGKDTKIFQYGQAVSKRRAQPHRELFRETHIIPRQCPDWWDIINFTP